MANIEEINKAVGAHGMWKMRLKMAIDSGKTDTPIESIAKEDQCAFGQWLFGPTLTSADKSTSNYVNVKDLHADFHKTAARVAELAIGGKKAEAEKMMDKGGEFSEKSSKLTSALMEWGKASK